MTSDRPFERAAIVGGAGAVGRLFAALLRETRTPLLLVDRREPPPEPGVTAIAADILRPGPVLLRELTSCDLVLLATPENIAISAVSGLGSALLGSTLLVDTLSVKSGFAEALAQSGFAGECLGINPMFAPDLGFAGRGVIITPYRDGPAARRFAGLMAERGALLSRMSADEHDRVCAALQVATHAAVLGFGMALRALDYDPGRMEALMPPPHRALLALLARMLAADPAVYHDIQAANPHAALMREQLQKAQQALDQRIAEGPEAFAATLNSLRGMLATSQVDYAALCARLFAVK
jgi:prephenate dehydrogenase